MKMWRRREHYQDEEEESEGVCLCVSERNLSHHQPFQVEKVPMIRILLLHIHNNNN